MKKRYLTDKIVSDLKEKMVLIAGPRQVGKTTLGKSIGQHYLSPSTYLNWDYQPDRKNIINHEFPADSKLLIFDELHKYKQWKNYIKGIFDKYKEIFHILVTGSARLDIYRKGGDSLMGRYHHYILHPFSLAEILELNSVQKPFHQLSFTKNKQSAEILRLLLRFGPFPEPYLKRNLTFWRRWQTERNDRLAKEEIRDLRMIGDISTMQILIDILPSRAASLLSINNIREDLQVAYKTTMNYLSILELFYFLFRIYPYTKKTVRSLKKMSKLYLWDWSVLDTDGAKFENLIASHLLKYADFLQNSLGFKTKVYYLREPEGKEVDFLFTVDQKPWFAVEAKLNKDKASPALLYFDKKINIPFLYQVTLESGIDVYQGKVRIVSADKFLTAFV